MRVCVCVCACVFLCVQQYVVRESLIFEAARVRTRNRWENVVRHINVNRDCIANIFACIDVGLSVNVMLLCIEVSYQANFTRTYIPVTFS